MIPDGFKRITMRVLLVLPTLDEEAGLASVLHRLLEDARFDAFDLVVVDGRSTDGTVAVAATFGVEVVLQHGQGKGAAFRTAVKIFLAGTWDALAMIDADGSYLPEALLSMVPLLKEETLVVGDRLGGVLEEGAMSRLNLLGNIALSGAASILNGTDAVDVCSGCWVMRRDLVQDLRLNSTGFEIEAEIFSASIAAGHRPRWVPIRYERRRGTAKLTSVFDGLRILRKLVVRRLLVATKTRL